MRHEEQANLHLGPWSLPAIQFFLVMQNASINRCTERQSTKAPLGNSGAPSAVPKFGLCTFGSPIFVAPLGSPSHVT